MDEHVIAERRRLGLDNRDEMWKRVLHVVPPPFQRHINIQSELLQALVPAASRRGFRVTQENGMFAATDDYRVPDLVVFDDALTSERGIEGTPVLVVEIRSPGDDTMEKIPWYLERGVGEVLVVDRDSLELELHTAAGITTPGPDGSLLLEALGVRISSDGGTLRVDGRPLRV